MKSKSVTGANGEALLGKGGNSAHGGFNRSARLSGYVPKLEFPSFDGCNLRSWINKR